MLLKNKRLLLFIPFLVTSFHTNLAFRYTYPIMKDIRSLFQTKENESNKKSRVETPATVGDVITVPEITTSSSVKSIDIVPRSTKKRVREVEEVGGEGETTVLSESVATCVGTVVKVNDVVVGWPPFDEIESGWRCRLQGEYRKPYFQKLLKFLEKETQAHTVFPPSSQIFTSLNLCSYDNVKVVVIGQDPYHGPGQAHGLAFSVQKGVALPPSLKNMITEAQNDPKVRIPSPAHGNLTCWSQQGVLLLNTALTVRKAEANSHQKQGWEEFTDAIVKELGKKEGLVYLLWGKPAQAK